MSYPDLLTDPVTYWEPTAPDAYGKMAFDTPVQINARYRDSNENFQDANGEEFISSAVVHVEDDLLHNGWIYNGTSVHADPQDQPGAYRIRKIMKSSNPAATITVRKVILG